MCPDSCTRRQRWSLHPSRWAAAARLCFGRNSCKRAQSSFSTAAEPHEREHKYSAQLVSRDDNRGFALRAWESDRQRVRRLLIVAFQQLNGWCQCVAHKDVSIIKNAFKQWSASASVAERVQTSPPRWAPNQTDDDMNHAVAVGGRRVVI